MSYRRRFIDQLQTEIPLDPLRGSRVMSRARASAVHATGDRVLTHGRRILARVGLHGAGQWQASSAPISGTLAHPHPTNERVAARTPPVPLTPGHFLRMVVLAAPSGLTSAEVDTIPAATGSKGWVKVAVTYANGITTSSVEHTIKIPASPLANAAEPTGAGAAWAAIRRDRTPLILPDVDLQILANLAAWCDGVTATITISYIGAPRVFDCVVSEEPLALAYDVSGGGWAAPMHAMGTGADLGQLPGKVPVTRRSVDDAGHGAEMLVDTATRVCVETGPVILYQSFWDEAGTLFSAAEASYNTTTNASFRELFMKTTAAWAATGSGWSAASGANARRVQDTEQSVVLRDATNVVPVRVWVYGSLTSVGATGALRVDTATYSIAEVPIPTGTTDAWHSATGHLRCNLGAQDPIVLQARARATAGSFRCRYLAIVYAGDL